MIIKNITINSFGKLDNYSIDLNDGVNVVYGANEYGKTTIMEFIKIMFYGRNEKTATDKLVREKYKPWNGSEMSGSITFEHGGQIYKIQKEISDKSSKSDKAIIQNLSVGEVIKLGKDEEIGEYFFGIDVKSFERSSYIKNIGGLDFEKSKSSKNAKDTLADKMFSNLLETDEDVSQSGVISKIKEAINELKTPTGRSGKIRKSESKISELKLKINDLNNFEKSQEDIKKELGNLSALMKEEKFIETKIKEFDEYRRIKEVETLLGMVSEKERIRENAAEFGVNLDDAAEIFGKLKKYDKDLNEINLKIENIKNLSGNRNKNFKKISEEEKNRFESMLKRFERERDKNETFKCLTTDNIDDQKLSDSVTAENLKNIGLKLKNREQLKEAKRLELERNRLKAKKLNNKFLFADGIFLMCSMVCLFANLLNLFPFAFGVFLCISAAHLYYLYKNKKSSEVLKNEISEKNSEIENLKSDFKSGIENSKSETENNLKDIEKEIKNLLSEKGCHSRMEFYQNYAKSVECEKFESVLQGSENDRNRILEDLKKFLVSKSVRISVNNFRETFSFLQELSSKYVNIGDQIKYKANAINLKNTGSENLKNILKEYCRPEREFESTDIDSLRSRFDELNKMNLHSAYIEMQKKVINTSEDPEKIKVYAEKLSLQKDKMEKYYECLRVSLGAFEEVSDELRKNFNPKLNSRASEIFKKLTGGKYDNLYIQKDYDFIVGAEAVDRYSHYFSSGTIDQAYLASRIAIAELVSSAKIPLIFDDTLMRYDDGRLKNTIGFLKSYADENAVQSIIFTCHDYLKNIIAVAVEDG